MTESTALQEMLQGFTRKQFAPFDFLGKGSLAEKAVALALGEEPADLPGGPQSWRPLAEALRSVDVHDLRVVALGGGTGLSRIVGGDSRRPEWKEDPFTGLKEVFPHLHSIVCVTDDGGSTGEMLKDFPLVGLGDLRRVLLASVRRSVLKNQYHLNDQQATETAAALHDLFNCRFAAPPASAEQLWAASGTAPEQLPAPLAGHLSVLVRRLFTDKRMTAVLPRPQCVGNLLIASAVYGKLPSFFRNAELLANQKRMQAATLEGIADLAAVMGAGRQAVLPCTVTPAQLQVLYANGVLVTGEAKAEQARRSYPVERVTVRFADDPLLPDETADLLRRADIIILAPGSLYTSIIPVLQVPGIADLIRGNRKALKLLVANIWVQQGETDATIEAPERKFYVSDLIQAYNRNISRGVHGLFSHVLTLNLADIPGSVLQNYALEDKHPIYVDSGQVRELGFEPVQARIFSRSLLAQENVVQHDPCTLAQAVQSLWGLRAVDFLPMPDGAGGLRRAAKELPVNVCSDRTLPCLRFEEISRIIGALSFRHIDAPAEPAKEMDAAASRCLAAAAAAVVWKHPDIQPEHLRVWAGLCIVSASAWQRCQQWDNVFSFYDPEDSCIKIREDQAENASRLETALLVGIGQSLLGNYCQEKKLEEVRLQEQPAGRVYWLKVRDQQELRSFFSPQELDVYLRLSRMQPSGKQRRVYLRLVNGDEGFMPPGLLCGLFFAWYLDSRLAPSIEYMMSLMKSNPEHLIARQKEMVSRREQLIRFFRETVFRSRIP